MYHRCLQLAGYDWSTILCGRRALLPNFRTTAHMWAPLSFSLYFPFFLFIVFPPSQWRKIKKQFSIAAFTSVKVDREWGSQPIYTLLPCCGREIEKCAEMKKSSMIDIKDARYQLCYGKQLMRSVQCCLNQFSALLYRPIFRVQGLG